MSAASIRPSSLSPRDVVRVGSVGLRTRKLRAALSMIGVAIGISSMVGVLGISTSSKADLLAALDRLGTNLLAVKPGQTFFGQSATLPKQAASMIGRVPGVASITAVEDLAGMTARRTHYIDRSITNAITVGSTTPNLPDALGATTASGSFLNDATSRYPSVVLGTTAAARLGIDRPGVQIWIGDRWFTVVGILNPVELAPALDSYALVGQTYAERRLGADGSPSMAYVRTDPDRVSEVHTVLGQTANPQHPEEVDVSRPSDALEARAAAKTAFTSLFLGLGAVALLVGGVGIANVMVISVLERRSEIGLRRALGATRRHIALQFLTESVLLGALGGLAGVLGGIAVTAAYAQSRGWAIVVPPYAMGLGFFAAVVIGAVAGLYPSVRGARVAPTTALRTA